MTMLPRKTADINPMLTTSIDDMAESRQRSFWVPVLCGAVILTIGIGARQSFGIFQKPIATELGVGRELWSFANALSMLLMGLLSPFVGNLADRFGTARTVAVGGALYVAGILTIAAATEGVMLTLGNVLVGIGTAAAGFGPILGAISRKTPARHRSIALGVATAGGSFGQFAIVPFASLMQQLLGSWHATMAILGAVSVLMVPLALGLREVRRPVANASSGAGRQQMHDQGTREALREAFNTPGFWLLTIGFFVCGFHVTFIGLHLPPYIADNAIGMNFFGARISPLELGGWAIGLVGLFNIAGALIWGWLGGRHPKKDMLALLYALRAATFVVFLMLPLSWISVLLFAASLGFLWLGTVPLTSGLVGTMFGPTHLSMLWGIVFFSHQLGSFFGGWGAGRLYDTQGNYNVMWWLSVGLGVLAALLHWQIRERPTPRLATAPA
jgi:MFS family permease